MLSQISIPGLLSSTSVTLAPKSCSSWQLDGSNTISINVKAVDGLACYERAASRQQPIIVGIG